MAKSDRLIVHSVRPLNAETRLDVLRDSFVTQNTEFYVRGHGAIPRLDGAQYRLVVGGMADRSLSLSIADLRALFPEQTVLATIQCAGNRRGEMSRIRPVSGIAWSAGAIGCAEWTGIRLADLLRHCGIGQAAAYVILRGLDDCDTETGERYRYEVSIPLAKALAGEVLLAWGMNGKALLPEHGFPLRAVVPGFAGVRSVKWLESIRLSDQPSDAYPQARDYKVFPPPVTKETANWSRGRTIDEMPVNAVICDPRDGAEVAAGPALIRGYATGQVVRAELSADRGASWTQAVLEQRGVWAWTFWAVTINLAPGARELAVRAWDAAGQTQPAEIGDNWNFRGYLCNAWHLVRVTVTSRR